MRMLNRRGIAIPRGDVGASGHRKFACADHRIASELAHDALARQRDVQDEIIAVDLGGPALGVNA